MNRRGFIRSLAIGGAAIAVVPNIAFKHTKEYDDSGYVVLQIFWPKENIKYATYEDRGYNWWSNVERGEVEATNFLALGVNKSSEFLAFRPSVFYEKVKPILEEDKVKYILSV